MTGMHRRALLRRGLRAVAGLSSGTVLPALRADQPPLSAVRLTPETLEVIRRGLDFLRAQQNPDGSYGRGPYSRNVAVCGLVAMAFMANGSMPHRGPYGQQVARTLNHILNSTRDSGFIVSPGSSSHGPMYGHGFATLFLAEVYGQSEDAEIRDKLEAATNLIINTQNEEGGWRYEPRRQDADISVTVCQIMALRAARNAGLYVPHRTIERSLDYVKRCQNPDGGFMYQLSQPGESRFPRSAAGVVAFYNAGIYEGPELARGLDYLMRHLPVDQTATREPYFFYGHYYAVQAMWQARGERWERWYPAIRELLEARRRADGSWFDQIAPEFGTAMACAILQMPNSFLPIFQR